MRLLGKPLSVITSSDLETLVTNGVRESRVLEYKRELPSGSEEDRREFLADAVAMANTDGGVILFGVETARDDDGKHTGVADGFPGLGGKNVEEERLKLLSLLKDGVSPPLVQRARFQEVTVGGKTLLLLGIEASLDRPHMVIFRGTTRFFRRSEGGKYQPAISELRRMFLESASWIDECEQFRRNRFRDRDGSDRFRATGKTMVHVLPLGRLSTRLDLRSQSTGMSRLLPPFGSSTSNLHFNSDGYWAFASTDNGKTISSYTQWFRFGGIEGLSYKFLHAGTTGSSEGANLLEALHLSVLFENYVDSAIRALAELFEIGPPFCVLLTLDGVQGARVCDRHGFLDGAPIDRNMLSLPPTVIEPDTNVRAACRAMMDEVWQAAGYPGEPLPPPRFVGM